MKFTDIINEDENKIKNKVKNVYRALKIGTITVQRGGPCKVKYVLPDEYMFTKSSHGNSEVPSVIINNKDVKFYTTGNDGEPYHLKYMSSFDFLDYITIVKDKFNRFNILLSVIGLH